MLIVFKHLVVFFIIHDGFDQKSQQSTLIVSFPDVEHRVQNITFRLFGKVFHHRGVTFFSRFNRAVRDFWNSGAGFLEGEKNREPEKHEKFLFLGGEEILTGLDEIVHQNRLVLYQVFNHLNGRIRIKIVHLLPDGVNGCFGYGLHGSFEFDDAIL